MPAEQLDHTASNPLRLITTTVNTAAANSSALDRHRRRPARAQGGGKGRGQVLVLHRASSSSLVPAATTAIHHDAAAPPCAAYRLDGRRLPAHCAYSSNFFCTDDDITNNRWTNTKIGWYVDPLRLGGAELAPSHSIVHFHALAQCTRPDQPSSAPRHIPLPHPFPTLPLQLQLSRVASPRPLDHGLTRSLAAAITTFVAATRAYRVTRQPSPTA